MVGLFVSKLSIVNKINMTSEKNFSRFEEFSTLYNTFGVDAKTTFSEVYPAINKVVMEEGQKMPSRYGNTMELLNYTTKIYNPTYRCVGGLGRNINVFFLLAEALWIWNGRKDVDFLEPFNSRMKEFSDDGVVFHAPYGYRLRNWGKSSNENIVPLEDSNKHAERDYNVGFDQLKKSLRMINDDNETRRVVMSIWNPDLDLGHNGVDLPCNDLVELIVRDEKLHMTIANRSNDLHWGLPTNVFQFSWILELSSLILGKGVGTQTHHSRSLHVYDHIPIAKSMLKRFKYSEIDKHLYECCDAMPIDFKFNEGASFDDRFKAVDNVVKYVLYLVSNARKNNEKDTTMFQHVRSISAYLADVAWILCSYVIYTNSDKGVEAKNALFRDLVAGYEACGERCNDYYLLAFNNLIIRVKGEAERDKMKRSIPEKENVSLRLLGDL